MKRSIVALSVVIATMYAEPADANRQKQQSVMNSETQEQPAHPSQQRRRRHPHSLKKVRRWKPNTHYRPFQNRVDVQRIYSPNHGLVTVTTNRQQWNSHRRSRRRGPVYVQRSPIRVYPSSHGFSRRQSFHCDHGISFGAYFPFQHSYRNSCPYTNYFTPKSHRRTSITVVAPKVNSYVGVQGNYDTQGLAQRINAAIQSRTDLLSQVESLSVTQQGGQVIYSGVVQNAQVLDQLVAIAWQEDGTESVNIDQVTVIERAPDFGQAPAETIVVKSAQPEWSSLRTELESLNSIQGQSF